MGQIFPSGRESRHGSGGTCGGETRPSALIEARGLSFAYRRGVPVFQDATFALGAGETLTVLGPNGAGKSTLLDCLAGLLHPTSGCVLLDGEPVETMERGRLARTLGYVSQLQASSLDFSVRDYLVLGRAPHIGRLRTPSTCDYEAVEGALAQLEIERLAAKSLRELSGGERQQVRIARVLVQRPRVVMLDEPTNHLDYGNQLKVLETIDRLAREEHMAVLLTTHTPDYAILLDGKCAVLDRTGHLEVGASADIVTEERLRAIYDADLCLVDVERVGRRACVAGGLGKRRGMAARDIDDTGAGNR